MARGEFPRRPVNDKFHPCAHNTEDIDPNILAVPPHDPYTLIPPLLPIREGDIKRIVGEGMHWVPVEEHEIGHKVPTCGVAYARATPPDGYVLAAMSDRTCVSDLVWFDALQDWRPISENLTLADQDVSWVTDSSRHNQLVFVAHVDKSRPSQQTVGLPPRHRPIYPGEKLRRGDKLIYDSLMHWTPVKEAAFRNAVDSPSALNGNARFCRPIGDHFQSWYIDEQKGLLEGLGGFSDPWPSLEIAQERIEAASQLTQTPPHGTIWTIDGVPVMIYDLLEPQNRGPVDETVTEEEQTLLDVMEAGKTAQTATELAAGPKKPVVIPVVSRKTTPLDVFAQYEVEKLSELTGLSPAEIRGNAQTCLPTLYRAAQPREELKKGDLVYGVLGDDYETLMWQPIHAEMTGSDPGTTDCLFARRTVPPKTDRIRELHAKMQTLLVDLGKLMQEVGDALR